MKGCQILMLIRQAVAERGGAVCASQVGKGRERSGQKEGEER